MKAHSFAFATLLTIAGHTAPAVAVDIDLSFGSLPSTQGWTYWTNSGTAEENVFSILNSNTLSQNTFGLGDRQAGYVLSDPLNANLSFDISFTARFIAEENGLNDFGAFGVIVNLDSEAFGVGIGPNRIKNVSHNTISTSIDTSSFHSYRMEVSPGIGYRLFVDGNFLGAGSPRYLSSPDYVLLGDFTGGANAMGEFTAFRIVQEVPELQSALLLAAGLSFLLIAKKGQRSSRLESASE